MHALNNQYLIVQDFKDDRKGDKQRRRNAANQNVYDWTNMNSSPLLGPEETTDKERLIDGEDTYYSRMHNETLDSLDSTTFLRHGDIADIDFKVQLNFLRDFRNCLQLLSTEDEVCYIEQLERDTTRQKIAKLATHNFKASPSGRKEEEIQGLLEDPTYKKASAVAEAALAAGAAMPVECTLDDFPL